MSKSQLAAMKGLAAQTVGLSWPPVESVGHYRKAQPGKMDSYLVGPSCVEQDFDEGMIWAEFLENVIVGKGRFSAGDYRHLNAISGISGDRLIDSASFGMGDAPDERPVNFVDFPISKLVL